MTILHVTIVLNVLVIILCILSIVVWKFNPRAEKPVKIEPAFENPNKSRMDMKHEIINAGFKMFRNPDTYWNVWEKTERWHGPLVCWGVDFNKCIYNTPAGDYTMVRDLTEEEMDRLVDEIQKTDGLVERISNWKPHEY